MEGVEDYFRFVEEENARRKITGDKLKPITISGICVHLGIAKDTWTEYSKREGFAVPMKRFKSIVENYVEDGVLNGTVNTIGGIFNLKNNHGWTDKQEITVNESSDKLTAEQIRDRLKHKKTVERDENKS